jgi:hypothetical protein
MLQKIQYLHGVTRRYRYKSAVSSVSASHVVYPMECFISPGMFDVEAIQKYSSAVVLHPKPDTNFADLKHVCGFLKDNLHARFRVKRLIDVAVLLYFDQDNPCMFVYEMSVSFEEWIHDGELELIQ